jgi:hypothetical protein
MRRVLSLCEAALVAGCTASAADAPEVLSEPQRAEAEAGVVAVLDSLFQAANRLDVDHQRSFFAADVTMVSSGAIVDWPATLEGHREYYKSLRLQHAELVNPSVTVFTSTLALAYGTYRWEHVDTLGVSTAGVDGLSYVLRRGPEGWRVIHAHESTPEKTDP